MGTARVCSQAMWVAVTSPRPPVRTARIVGASKPEAA